MLPIPMKGTSRVDIATPLLAYLKGRYSEAEATRHADAVNAFQTLRNNVADAKLANDGAKEAILQYIGQLDNAMDKFPVSETSIRIAFSWTDSLQPGGVTSQYSWIFEKCNCLFNLASIESHLANAVNRDSPEGIERAGKLYCGAASILQHLKDTYAAGLVGTVPMDLSVQGLNMLIALQLAQGQACYYERANGKDMSPDILARIAGQAADLYRTTSRILPESITAEMDKQFPWSLYIKMHCATFDSVSFWNMSKKARADANAKGDGYGLEIAWLKVAENAAGAAIDSVRSSRSPLAASVSTASAEVLQKRISGRREEAEHDNNKIYINTVPAARELPSVPRAELAKITPVPDWSKYRTKDLFDSIVPLEVANSMAKLEEELRAAASSARDQAAAYTATARDLLSAFGLPGYLDACDPSAVGVPPALWERIKKTQIEGALGELERLLAGNKATAAGTLSVLTKVNQVLGDEAAADSACRATYGDKWTATPSGVISSELRGDVAKYLKLGDVAAASDALVAAKLDANRGRLSHLSKSKGELDALVPGGYAPGASGGVTSQVETLRGQMKDTLSQLETLIAARTKLGNDIAESFDRRSAVSAYLAASPTDHAAVTERLLLASSPAKKSLDANLQAQAALLDVLRAQHARFAEVRSGDERTRAREAAIQDLSAAVDRFEEIRSNLKEGDQFYRDLRSQADRLLRTAEDMASARGLQQRELMMNLRAAAEADERAKTDAEAAAHLAASYAPAPTPGPSTAYPSTAGWGQSAAPHPYHGAPSGGMAVPVQLPTSGPADPRGNWFSAPPNPFDAFPAYSGGAMPPSHGAPTSSPPLSPTTHGAGASGGYHHPAPGGYGPPYSGPAPSGYHAPYGAPPQGAPAPAPYYTPAPPAAVPGVSPQVQQLLNMGFDRARAEGALAAHGGDVGRAVSALLDGRA